MEVNEYRLVDYSDDNGQDFAVEDEFGEVGRFFTQTEAKQHLAELRWIARLEGEETWR